MTARERLAGGPMTPDDVVARARELVGQEVLLTVRGVVMVDQGAVALARDNGLWTTLTQAAGHASPSLVSIEPAPIRIEPGALYRNGDGELLRGDSDGGLQGFDGYIGASEIGPDSNLVRVKVVDA